MYLDDHLVPSIEAGAILHDIGKIGIPDAILLKSCRLSADEYEPVKKRITNSAGPPSAPFAAWNKPASTSSTTTSALTVRVTPQA
jgi:hypothetical protein